MLGWNENFLLYIFDCRVWDLYCPYVTDFRVSLSKWHLRLLLDFNAGEAQLREDTDDCLLNSYLDMERRVCLKSPVLLSQGHGTNMHSLVKCPTEYFRISVSSNASLSMLARYFNI